MLEVRGSSSAQLTFNVTSLKSIFRSLRSCLRHNDERSSFDEAVNYFCPLSKIFAHAANYPFSWKMLHPSANDFSSTRPKFILINWRSTLTWMELRKSARENEILTLKVHKIFKSLSMSRSKGDMFQSLRSKQRTHPP